MPPPLVSKEMDEFEWWERDKFPGRFSCLSEVEIESGSSAYGGWPRVSLECEGYEGHAGPHRCKVKGHIVTFEKEGS